MLKLYPLPLAPSMRCFLGSGAFSLVVDGMAICRARGDFIEMSSEAGKDDDITKDDSESYLCDAEKCQYFSALLKDDAGMVLTPTW